MFQNIVLILFIISSFGFAQIKSPETILEKVKQEFEKVADYKVKVKIKVDIDFIKMSDREATIYYKKPDKFHIDSKNFTMLPKSGLNFTPLGFLDYKYTAFFEKTDTIDGAICTVVKVIPLEGNADVVLSTFWVDEKRNLILKVESSRKPQGTFVINLKYEKTKPGFWLPSSMVFNFSIDPSLLPGRQRDNPKTDNEKTAKDEEKSQTGSVYLEYSNYKVNIGLSDDLFPEREKEK